MITALHPDLILVAELKSRLETARMSLLQGMTRAPHGHLSWVNHHVFWPSEWPKMKLQVAELTLPSICKDMAWANLCLLRKPPDVRPAPCFSLQDFKETYKEESLIHPSLGEEALFSPGGEGLIHCGSCKSGGWGAQGSPAILCTWESKRGLRVQLQPLSQCDSGTLLRSLEAWEWGRGAGPRCPHPLVPENPSLRIAYHS